MEYWPTSSRYSFKEYPLGPVASNQSDQGFLWLGGDRAPSNFSFIDASEKDPAKDPLGLVAQEFRQALPVVPAGCMPLKGGCMSPPLSLCRSGIKYP